MLSVMRSPPTIDDQIENVLKSRGSHLQSPLQIQIQIKLLLLLSYLKKVDHHLCDILENHNGIWIFANNGSLAIRIDGKQCRKTTCFLQLCENFQLPYFYKSIFQRVYELEQGDDNGKKNNEFSRENKCDKTLMVDFDGRFAVYICYIMQPAIPCQYHHHYLAGFLFTLPM